MYAFSYGNASAWMLPKIAELVIFDWKRKRYLYDSERCRAI